MSQSIIVLGDRTCHPRLDVRAPQQWLHLFDVLDEELLDYQAKLLDEPKLTDDTLLAARL